MIDESSKKFEARRIEHSDLNRTLLMKDFPSVFDTWRTETAYNICSRVSLSNAGLVNHISYTNKHSKISFIKVFQQQPTGNSYQYSKYVCLQLVREFLWEFMGAMTTKKSANLFFKHVVGLIGIYVFSHTRSQGYAQQMFSSAKKWVSHTLIYIYIYVYIYIYMDKSRNKRVGTLDTRLR